MATTVTKVIDPDMGSGYDYDSLYDWEAAQQGDLTGARDEIAVAKCRCTAGTADSTAVTIDGWTTSSTQYPKVWTDPTESYRHNGTFQTGNKYRLTAAIDGSLLSNVEAYTQILGLQIYNSYSTAGDHNPQIVDDTGGSVRVGYCVLRGNGGSDYAKGIRLGSNSIGFNSVVYDVNTAAVGITYGFGCGRQNMATLVRWYNITVHNCNRGFASPDDGVSAANQMTVKNCLAKSCTDGFWAGYQFHSDSDYNASDIASDAPGTNSRNGQTFSFVDESGDNFHLASNDAGAKGYGTNLYNDANLPFQTDIQGHDRGGSGATWDIGAFMANIASTVCWGHVTGVTQTLKRTFFGNWRGTGTISGSGDSEKITLTPGQYMESEIVKTGAGNVTLGKDGYT